MENSVGFYKCVGSNRLGSNYSVIQYIASGESMHVFLTFYSYHTNAQNHEH